MPHIFQELYAHDYASRHAIMMPPMPPRCAATAKFMPALHICTAFSIDCAISTFMHESFIIFFFLPLIWHTRIGYYFIFMRALRAALFRRNFSAGHQLRAEMIGDIYTMARHDD